MHDRTTLGFAKDAVQQGAKKYFRFVPALRKRKVK